MLPRSGCQGINQTVNRNEYADFQQSMYAKEGTHIMKHRSILLFAGLAAAFVFSCLLVRIVSLERQVAKDRKQIAVQRSIVEDLSRQNNKQREQIAMICETATQARSSFKRISIMCGKTQTGVSIHWIGLTNEVQADLDTCIKTLEAVSNER